MWVPKEVADWFKISKDSVDALREELAACKAERDSLKLNLSIAQNNLEWIRKQINGLQYERTQLLEKAYGIVVPVPEIARVNKAPAVKDEFSFDDIGDDLAKKLGLPVYDDPTK